MIKRCFDTCFSIFGLLILIPALLIVGFLVKLSSPGSVFYRGVRTGLHGKPFRIYKFRTMMQDAESKGGPSTALDDCRLTSVGKFLRKYKIDELPQLINILLGEMSFVGPRPQVEKYTKLYNEEEKIILSVRPGLTDYASIRFVNLDSVLGNDNVDEKYLREIEPDKNHLRMKYVRERSFWVDLKILFLTGVRLCKLRSIWNTRN